MIEYYKMPAKFREGGFILSKEDNRYETGWSYYNLEKNGWMELNTRYYGFNKKKKITKEEAFIEML